jgi:hypothetical protein
MRWAEEAGGAEMDEQQPVDDEAAEDCHFLSWCDGHTSKQAPVY